MVFCFGCLHLTPSFSARVENGSFNSRCVSAAHYIWISSRAESLGAGIQPSSQPNGPGLDQVLEHLKFRHSQQIWPGRLHLAGWIEEKEKMKYGERGAEQTHTSSARRQ